MSVLKSLTFIQAPAKLSSDPKLRRRQRLIDRIEQQRKLADDPNFTVTVRRWIKDANGVKQPVDRQKRIKPWWKTDETGRLVLVLKNGLKTMEIEKGKPGIVVGAQTRLEGVLETLIAATRAGELDAALEASTAVIERRSGPAVIRRVKAT